MHFMHVFIKVVVSAPSSVYFSTTSTYVSSSLFMYSCVPYHCDAGPQPTWVTRGGEEFTERGPNFSTMSSSFKLCPTHFSTRRKIFQGRSSLVSGLLRCMLKPRALRTGVKTLYTINYYIKHFAVVSDAPACCT